MSAQMVTAMPSVDRRAASQAAVIARQQRAALKDDLRLGRRDHQQVLVEAKADPNTPAGKLRVPEFLQTLPFVGEVKQAKIMAELKISPRKRLGGLGQHQAKELWDFLGFWLGKYPIETGRG